MIGRLIFRLIKPCLEDWWRDRILAYHEGLVDRQQIGPPVGPVARQSADIINFPSE